MMPSCGHNRRLIACLAVSICLHAGATVLLSLPVLGDSLGSDAMPLRQRNPLVLGDLAGAVASIDWIGFESAREHRARLSEVNQPALSVSGGAAPVTESPAAPAQAASAPVRSEARPAVRLPRSFADMPLAIEESDARPLFEVLPVPAQRPVRSVAGEARQASQGGPLADPGAPSEQESVAASRTPPTEVNPTSGEIVSAAGLKIRTVRPRFDKLTRVTARPRNPLMRVSFRKDGRVARVEVLESSGGKAVDDPVVHALYNWTATGKPLEALGEGPEATVDVEIRILLRQ